MIKFGRIVPRSLFGAMKANTYRTGTPLSTIERPVFQSILLETGLKFYKKSARKIERLLLFCLRKDYLVSSALVSSTLVSSALVSAGFAGAHLEANVI